MATVVPVAKSNPRPDKNLDRLVDEKVRQNLDLSETTRYLIWRSFLRGLFGGLGGVIGATLMVAVLLFMLNKVGAHLPLVGHYFRAVGQTIQQERGKSVK